MLAPVTNRFNYRLKLWIASLVGIVLIKLFMAAYESGNWRGFVFTAFHVILVALVSFYVLRRSRSPSFTLH